MYFIILHSSDHALIAKAKSLYGSTSKYIIEKQFGSYLLQAYSNCEIQKYNIVSSINKMGEPAKDDTFLSDEQDEIISKMLWLSECARFVTDYWGMMPFYYHKSHATYLISNNIFLIQQLVESTISEKVVFESMMFKKPLKKRTWFSKIHSSLPGEMIELDFRGGKLVHTSSNHKPGLFEGSAKNYIDEAENFFSKSLTYLETANKRVAVSLSAGSDSRTVLAGVMARKSEFTS